MVPSVFNLLSTSLSISRYTTPTEKLASSIAVQTSTTTRIRGSPIPSHLLTVSLISSDHLVTPYSTMELLGDEKTAFRPSPTSTLLPSSVAPASSSTMSSLEEMYFVPLNTDVVEIVSSMTLRTTKVQFPSPTPSGIQFGSSSTLQQVLPSPTTRRMAQLTSTFTLEQKSSQAPSPSHPSAFVSHVFTAVVFQQQPSSFSPLPSPSSIPPLPASSPAVDVPSSSSTSSVVRSPSHSISSVAATSQLEVPLSLPSAAIASSSLSLSLPLDQTSVRLVPVSPTKPPVESSSFVGLDPTPTSQGPKTITDTKEGESILSCSYAYEMMKGSLL